MLFILLLFLGISCHAPAKKKDLKDSFSTFNTFSFSKSELENMEEWIKREVCHFLNTQKGIVTFNDQADSASIFTKEYAEFKRDAIALYTSKAISEKDFDDKYDGKFDIEGTYFEPSFLINALDFGVITVDSVKFQDYDETGDPWFDVVFTDQQHQVSYHRMLGLCIYKNTYLIKNVIENY